MTTSTTTTRSRKSSGVSSSIQSILPYFFIFYLFFYIHVIQRASILKEVQHDMNRQQKESLLKASAKELSLRKSIKALEQEQRKQQEQNTNNNKEVEQTKIVSTLKNQIFLLQQKIDAFLGWGTHGDPFHSSKIHTKCYQKKAVRGSGHDYGLCLDDFPYGDCVVYEFGIRSEPEFGVQMMESPYNCQVHAFDPSPITKNWYIGPSETATTLKQNPEKYQLHDYGGGHSDETITLWEYNWGQVSIYHYPTMVINPNNCTTSGHCRYHKYPTQKEHKLPVRSVESIMNELGHDRVTVLKLDVEGSEYRMLESLIDSGTCQKIDQILVEWHHYDFDLRYGASSIPVHNVLHRMLEEKCGLYQYWIHDPTGWPSNEKLYADMGIILRYNIASFKRPSSEEAAKGQSPVILQTKTKDKDDDKNDNNGNETRILTKKK